VVDSSWDNSGLPPQKKGLGTGMKVLLGCGIAALLALVTCAVGGVILGNMIKKDPKAFEKRVEGFAKGLVQKDWERFRTLVGQLQTDDGARALYRANSGLHQAHPTEDQFLQATRTWRPRLGALPAEAPVGNHHHRHRSEDEPATENGVAAEPSKAPSVNITKVFGTTRIQCRYPGGALVSATFDGGGVQRIQVE
jgi:hypothetical protein